ncbi:MAG TPA: hypothetical protein VHV55_02795 [Pirellulales bacterium]|jgi:hypothetical protein|nr:hypothetical protein [Pirellulales bacterium]
MSEYQYVGFRAIDRPVNGKDLEFMQRQSSRAEITPWSFDNEYHHGDFRGNAAEMLRRGYDFHLHYANFGIRTLMIRLPNGLPDEDAAKPYISKKTLKLLKDERGPGRILCVPPFFESGELDELWEPESLVDRLIPLRAEILDGDLRPLYLANLAVASDDNHDPDEQSEAPVPGGLHRLTDAQRALADLYGLDESFIAAAALNSPPMPERNDPQREYAPWLHQQLDSTKNAWLAQLMADPHSTIRSEILTKFRSDQAVPPWPVNRSARTISELRAAAEDVQLKQDQKQAATAARKRAARLKALAADPMQAVRESEQLVEQRTTAAYQQAVSLLTDLRESLIGSKQSDLPEKQARKLKEQHPTARGLAAELRRHGFLKK